MMAVVVVMMMRLRSVGKTLHTGGLLLMVMMVVIRTYVGALSEMTMKELGARHMLMMVVVNFSVRGQQSIGIPEVIVMMLMVVGLIVKIVIHRVVDAGMVVVVVFLLQLVLVARMVPGF